MCGITGFWSDPPLPPEDARAQVQIMAAALEHRGPDDHGAWLDAPRGLALGHRRLSILDLSEEGHQPMARPHRRYVLCYNGEIYNFRELRADLEAEGLRFRGQSDTEILLGALHQWGLERALSRLNGMFAMAVWDLQTRQLTLVRDRLGIKPLYYGQLGAAVVFGSELAALTAFDGFDAPVDRSALAAYMRYNVVPAGASIYQGVRKLPPGCLVTFRHPRHTPAERRWWAADEVVAEARASCALRTPQDAVDAVEALLKDAVRQRMIADVPLGAFLSGGIDSTTVVALMRAVGGGPVRTFTIGFSEGAYNEAEDAKRVAAHLGVDHTELYLSPQDALDVVPRLPHMFDEPFADSSQIPTHLVSRLAREHVTVALSGDGGDELFGGYNRHTWAPGLWRRMRHVPAPVRRWAARRLRAVSPLAWDRGFAALGRALPPRLRVRTPGDKLHKLANVADADSAMAVYRRLVSHWPSPLEVVRADREAPAGGLGAPGDLGFTETMMLQDLQRYLPDDILTKVDRASMAVGLEARVPLLDHRVVELAWSLPIGWKIRDGVGKWPLRQVLDRHVPRALVERPKMGFGIPIDAWLRGPLRDWAEALLRPGRLASEGYFHPAPIRRMWEAHLSGRCNAQHELWDVLMFQAWLESRQPRRRLAA